jgi:hypothetical protein
MTGQMMAYASSALLIVTRWHDQEQLDAYKTIKSDLFLRVRRWPTAISKWSESVNPSNGTTPYKYD